MVPRRILTYLVVAGLVLPISVSVVLGVARLLGAMQDTAGAGALDRVALGLGIVWGIDLICLLTAQGINSLRPDDEPREPPLQ